MKRIILVFIQFLLMSGLFAQDIHFSDICSAQRQLNPASTGNYTGKWSAANNYRLQGDALQNHYSTLSLVVDKPFKIGRERISFGLGFFNDNTGQSGLLRNEFALSSAYFLRTGEHSYTQAGAKLLLKNIRTSTNGVSYPDQYNNRSGMFDAGLPTDEKLQKASISLPDAALGILWVYNARANTVNLGFSLQHLNRNQRSFYGIEIRSPLRYNFYYSGKREFENRNYLKVSGIYSYTSAASELLNGVFWGKNFSEDFVLNTAEIGLLMRGGFNRNQDAVTFSLSAEKNQFRYSLLYDINITKAKNNPGLSSAIEFSVFFIKALPGAKDKRIPCVIPI